MSKPDDKNLNLVYIVEVIIRNDKTGELLSETVGVYDKLSLAEEYRNKCDDDLSAEEQNYILYDVRAIVLNRMPDVLNPRLYEAEQLTLKQLSSGLDVDIEPDVFEEAIIEMINKGYVDQLIGEDGEFYYELTEKGREAGKEIFLQDLENELEEEDKEIKDKLDDWQQFGDIEWDEDDNFEDWRKFL